MLRCCFRASIGSAAVHDLRTAFRRCYLSTGKRYCRMNTHRLQAVGQDALAHHLQTLPPNDQAALNAELQSLDLDFVTKVFQASVAATKAGPDLNEVSPATVVQEIKGSSEERLQWRQIGLQLLAEGKAAVLLLAGGQGTRLGSSAPKGCYDIGLPSHKSLFQLQAERLLRLQALAAAACYGPGAAPHKPLLWYIMTSPFTHTATLQHFEQHAYFGLQAQQVVFFQQGFLPSFTEEGNIILATPTKVAKNPDGNGGLYMSLLQTGTLEHMSKAGVQCLDCYSVDNVLVRPGEPTFLGYCYSQGADCGAKVVSRASADEKVGVYATRSGSLQVIEYSELDPTQAGATDPATGQLLYNWANLCMHYFSVPWLEAVAEKLQHGAAYHVARKTIPSKDGPVAGIKLELFIFDTFPMAKKVSLFEVVRAEEFSPVKNAPGSATDSPDTAKAHLMALHKRWVEAAGGTVACREGVEVSPLVSYQGEGLEPICSRQTFSQPWVDDLQAPPKPDAAIGTVWM